MVINLGTFSIRIERMVKGKPGVLVNNGAVNTDLMEKENLTMEELMSRLRAEGISNIKEVQVAVLELNGNLSVKKKRVSNA